MKRSGSILNILLICNLIVWLYLAWIGLQVITIWLAGNKLMRNEEQLDLDEERVQQHRQNLVRKHCQSHPSGTAQSIIIDPHSAVSYCLSRKIASTFWLQVLSYLSLYDEERHLEIFSPLNLSKLDVHLRPKLNFFTLERGDHRRLVFNTTRFMFVRDPYTRLWSVYLDKFIIIDSWFFNNFGTKILQRRGVKVTNMADVCNKDYHISFQDFLDFVVFWNKKTKGQMDDHFGTIINHCNPCKFKPDFIGKLESFQKDSDYVLRRLNFGDFGEYLQKQDHVLVEMELLINYNLYMFKKFKGCFSWCITRLLDAFRMNGYLSDESVGRIKQRLPLNRHEMLETVISEYRKHHRTKSQISRLRHASMIRAYSQVKRTTLLDIEKIYEEEMVMFGYERFPKEIFDQ